MASTEASKQALEKLLRVYRGVRQPSISETGQLAGVRNVDSQYNKTINMVPGSTFWTTNPKTANTYVWRHGGANSVLVPADLVAKPDLVLDAEGSFWNDFFTGRGRKMQQYRKALKDPEVRSVMINNVVDPGGQVWDYVPEMAATKPDLTMSDALREYFIGNNLLVKDPRVLRYLSGETPKYATGGLAQLAKGTLQDVLEQAPEKKALGPKLKTFTVAQRIAEGSLNQPRPTIADFIKPEDVAPGSPLRRLLELEQAGFDTSRILYTTAEHQTPRSRRVVIELSPALIEDQVLETSAKRLLHGMDNMTAKDLENNYTYQKLMKPGRKRGPDDIETLKAQKAQMRETYARGKKGERGADDLFYESTLPGITPVFARRDQVEPFSSFSNSIAAEDLISIFGKPGEEGLLKYRKGGLAKLKEKYRG